MEGESCNGLSLGACLFQFGSSHHLTVEYRLKIYKHLNSWRFRIAMTSENNGITRIKILNYFLAPVHQGFGNPRLVFSHILY